MTAPHNQCQPVSARANWTPEQFWEYVAGLSGDFEAAQIREMAAKQGLTVVPAGSGVQGGDARIAERLTDVVMMLDTPDAYARPYVAAVCRSILSSLLPSAMLGGKDE